MKGWTAIQAMVMTLVAKTACIRILYNDEIDTCLFLHQGQPNLERVMLFTIYKRHKEGGPRTSATISGRKRQWPGGPDLKET
jgi:hypothetical protein